MRPGLKGVEVAVGVRLRVERVGWVGGGDDGQEMLLRFCERGRSPVGLSVRSFELWYENIRTVGLIPRSTVFRSPILLSPL